MRNGIFCFYCSIIKSKFNILKYKTNFSQKNQKEDFSFKKFILKNFKKYRNFQQNIFYKYIW